MSKLSPVKVWDGLTYKQQAHVGIGLAYGVGGAVGLLLMAAGVALGKLTR